MTLLTPLARATIILSWLLVGVACAASALQVVWLRIRKGRVSAAEICFFAAFVVGVLVVAQTTWALIDEGAGKHQADLEEKNIAAVAKVSCVFKMTRWYPDANKSLIISEVLWSLCGCLIRVSGCCFLRRIFFSFYPLSYILITILWLCIAHGVASVLEPCLICRPLAAQWNPLSGGLCGNQMASFTAIEVTGLALDLAILASPVPGLCSLHMNLAQRLKIILIIDSGAL
jgi:hypothetical protein